MSQKCLISLMSQKSFLDIKIILNHTYQDINNSITNNGMYLLKERYTLCILFHTKFKIFLSSLIYYLYRLYHAAL